MTYIYSSYVVIIYRTLLHSPINTNLCIQPRPITTIMQQAMTTACPLLEDPRRCAHQERLGGRYTNNPRLWLLCYYTVFTVFAICVTDIYPKTHKPRGRASDVSTISTCFFYFSDMIYCPLPHQSLWERLGVSLSCTCVAFSPLLN